MSGGSLSKVLAWQAEIRPRVNRDRPGMRLELSAPPTNSQLLYRQSVAPWRVRRLMSVAWPRARAGAAAKRPLQPPAEHDWSPPPNRTERSVLQGVVLRPHGRDREAGRHGPRPKVLRIQPALPVAHCAAWPPDRCFLPCVDQRERISADQTRLRMMRGPYAIVIKRRIGGIRRRPVLDALHLDPNLELAPVQFRVSAAFTRPFPRPSACSGVPGVEASSLRGSRSRQRTPGRQPARLPASRARFPDIRR